MVIHKSVNNICSIYLSEQDVKFHWEQEMIISSCFSKKIISRTDKRYFQIQAGPYFMIFYDNSNPQKNSSWSHPHTNRLIVAKFFTQYDSCIVVACVKFSSELLDINLITAITTKWNLDGIWITSRIISVMGSVLASGGASSIGGWCIKIWKRRLVCLLKKMKWLQFCNVQVKQIISDQNLKKKNNMLASPTRQLLIPCGYCHQRNYYSVTAMYIMHDLYQLWIASIWGMDK